MSMVSFRVSAVLIIIHAAATCESLQLENFTSPCEESLDLIDSAAGESLFSNLPLSLKANLTSANVAVRLHVVINAVILRAVVNIMDSWIAGQREKDSSIRQLWLTQTGINFQDIDYTIYLLQNDKDQSNISPRHRIVELNETAWQDVVGASNPISVSVGGSAGREYCRAGQHNITFNISGSFIKIIEPISDPGCGIMPTKCAKIEDYLTCPREQEVSDLFYYRIETNGTILVSLYANIRNKIGFIDQKVVFSSINTSKLYVLKQSGLYWIALRNLNDTEASVNFTYYFQKHDCWRAGLYVDNWIASGYLDLSKINVILPDIRMQLLSGVEEYVSFSPLGDRAAVLLKYFRSFNSDSISLWSYITESFGATIKRQDLTDTCQNIDENIRNSTVAILQQPEKLRCWMYNAKEPFGQNFNRSLIHVHHADGNVVKLYVPYERAHGNNLYCNEQKMCIWHRHSSTVTPSPAVVANTTSTSTDKSSNTFPTPSSVTCGSLNRDKDSCKETDHDKTASISFYFDRATSTLRRKDIEDWIWVNYKRSVLSVCVKLHAIIVKILINDIYELSYALAEVQSKLMRNQLFLSNSRVCRIHIVDHYDCDEIDDDYLCQGSSNEIKSWHIVNISIGSIIMIIDIIWIYCLYKHYCQCKKHK